MAFGDNIQKLRNSRGMSQQEFADTIGIGRSTLANYEQNKREPNYKTLEIIAKYFNVSIDYILGLTDDKNDYTHKDTSNEIVYKQILKLFDSKEYELSKNENTILNLIKNGTFAVNEKTIDSIASIYGTNSAYLVGKSDTYYSYDQNNAEDILTREKIHELLLDPDAIIEEFYDRKQKEYEKLIINKAFNILSDLGINTIKGQHIGTIPPNLLSIYYRAIIDYLKNSIKMVDFDKVVDTYKESIDNQQLDNETILRNEKSNLENSKSSSYYHDYYAVNKTTSIESVKNSYQFEKYLAYLLVLNDYDVEREIPSSYDVRQQKTEPIIIAEKNGLKVYITCEFFENEADLKEINEILKEYINYFDKHYKEFNDINSNRFYYAVATNLENHPFFNHKNFAVWGKNDIRNLERNAK